MKTNDLGIYVLAFNEANAIEEVITKIRNYSRSPIIISDDGSADDTPLIGQDISQKLKNVTLITGKQNLGFGGNLKRVFDHAIKFGYLNAVIIDGDLQHDPKFIPQILNELDKAPIVNGTRFHPESEILSEAPKINAFANETCRSIMQLLEIPVSDPLSMYLALNIRKLSGISIKNYGYSSPLEFWYEVKKRGIPFTEIPTSMVYFKRDYTRHSTPQKVHEHAKDFLGTTLYLLRSLPKEKRLRSYDKFIINAIRIWKEGLFKLEPNQISSLTKALVEVVRKHIIS